MSKKYQTTKLCYLIDHHSPQPPTVPLNRLDPAEYEAFVRESGVDSQMVYCKDHWGVSYYPSKVSGAQVHKGLQGDWLAQASDILRRCEVEFVAYYCIEYDEGAARAFPQWRVRKADGSPRIREDEFARWSLCCYQTGYRAYCLDQLREIVSSYHPDALFLDIFGSSLCYCASCKEKFLSKTGYPLPEEESQVAAHQTDILSFLEDNAAEFFDELRRELSKIDPELAITVNFSCHYPAEFRKRLDYQFSEPLLGDNWFSAAYARDCAEGQYPILAPGEASQVYNYSPVEKYRFDFHTIAAQGCRVGMYSGSQHIDGTLEHEEARRIGAVYRELAAMRPYLEGRQPLECVGILQSDASAKAVGGFHPDAILRAKIHNPHIRAILGAMRLCENAKLPWRALPEQSLTASRLAEYSVLLLPEVFVLSDSLVELLTDYVRQGGRLLVSPSCGRYREDGQLRDHSPLAQLSGVELVRMREEYRRNRWGAYLTPVEGEAFGGVLGRTTPPVSGSFAEFRLHEGESLLNFTLPCVAVSDTEWVNWWSPPPGQATNLPALTCREYGDGTVFSLAFDLFTMGDEGGFHYLDELFAGILSRMNLRPPARLVTETPLLLRTGFFRRDNELLVHQISNLPYQFDGQSAPLSGGALRLDAKRFSYQSAAVVWPVPQPLALRRTQDGYLEVDLPAFTLGQIISLQ